MAEEEEQASSNDQIVEKLQLFVIQGIKEGKGKEQIAKDLIAQGVDKSNAEQIVFAIYEGIADALKAQRYTPDAFFPGLAGGVAAALVGGALWAALIIGPGVELGILAWGLGWACGWAVVKAAGGKRGLPLQLTAVACSLVSILIGKYGAFYHVFRGIVESKAGPEAAAKLSLFSGAMVEFFFKHGLERMLDPYDILWVILAVITSWRMAQASDIQLPD